MGWCGVNDAESLLGLKTAFELGATHFDTADIYGHGHSERLLGRLVRECNREQITIGTKFGYFSGTAVSAYDPIHIQHQLETSLRNLETEYVDIYYFHNFNFGEDDQYLDGAIETVNRLKKSGKIRAIGMRGPHRFAPSRYSNSVSPKNKYDTFFEVAEKIDPDVVQVRCNLLTPRTGRSVYDVFRWAESKNVGVVMNKPLGQGLLLNKYDPASPPVFPAGDHRRRKRWFSGVGLAAIKRRVELLQTRFGSSEADMISLCISYCLQQSELACVVAGFTNHTQIAASLKAEITSLSLDDLSFISDAMAGLHDEIGSFFEGGASGN